MLLEPGHFPVTQGCQGGVHMRQRQAAQAAAGQLERQLLYAVHCSSQMFMQIALFLASGGPCIES